MNVMKQKAVILFSGGIDSLVNLALATKAQQDCYTLSIDYGQRHRAELNAAKKIASEYHVKEHKIIRVSLDELGGSALTDKNMSIPENGKDSSVNSTYVPARNTIFLSIALAYADTVGASLIYFGANKADFNGFPDARPDFLQAFEKVAQIQRKDQLKPITIVTPLINMVKTEIIKLGIELNVDFSASITCYQATNQGSACGYCGSCIIRKEAFASVAIPDPTHYYKKSANLINSKG